MYRTYIITNWVDNMIYYGSTKLTSRERMDCHNSEARKGNPKRLSSYMRMIGLDKFNITIIQDFIPNKLEARKSEQQLIDNAPNRELLLNATRAYTSNTYYTRDRAKLLAKKKRHYDKKIQDNVWCEKEKERNKIRMREKRAFLRESQILMLIDI